MRTIKAAYKYFEAMKSRPSEFGDIKAFADNVHFAKPFVISDSLVGREFAVPNTNIYLPFKVCSFEMQTPQPLMDSNYGTDGWRSRFGFCPKIIGTIFMENDDLSIEKMMLLFDPKEEKDVWFNNINYIPKNYFSHVYKFNNYDEFNNDITNIQLLAILYDKKNMVGETKHPFRFKKTGRIPELVSRLVVISDKKYLTKNIDGSQVDWQHKWRVRGHWRKIGSGMLGKDRDGNYTIFGNTWVKDFIKGDGPLIEKTRILKGDTNELQRSP